MPRSTRSAAKAGKQAIAGQDPTSHNSPVLAGDGTNTPVDQKEVAKTPSKAIPVPNTMSSKKRKRFAAKSWPWTEERPTVEAAAEQKRTSGRNLIPWQRPRMVEKFLLNLEYECTRQGVAIPWEDIAHRFHPGATAAGVQQHFARLRSLMAAEGHLIPPKVPTKKDRGPVDSTIRGYLRTAIDEDGKVVVRSVKYTEPLEHPTFNRADAHDMGAYKETKTVATEIVVPNNDDEALEALIKSERRRKTRVPIKYEDTNVSETESEDSEDDATDRVPLRAEEVEPEEMPLPFDQMPDPDDPEEVALHLYTQNMYPKVKSDDPRPVYFIDGEYMSFKEVCTRSLKVLQRDGYIDEACGRIIASHAHWGPPPPLEHFQSSSTVMPVAHYPDLHRPRPSLPSSAVNTMSPRLENSLPVNNPVSGRATNTMSPRLNNLGTGSNNNQLASATPTGNAHADVGLFGPYNNASSSAGSGPRFNTGFNTEFTGRMGSAADYKSPADHRTLARWFNFDDDGLPSDDFSEWRVDHNMRDNTDGVMSSGPGNDQVFNSATYSHHLHRPDHMTAGQVDSRVGRELSNNPFASNSSIVTSGNGGSIPGSGSSVTARDMASPQDYSMPEHPSAPELGPSHEPVMEEFHFDEQLDNFAWIDHPNDDKDTTGLHYQPEQ